MADWNVALDGYQKPTNAPVPTYAQVVGVVNKKAEPRDYMLTAAGGLPGETIKVGAARPPIAMTSNSASPVWAMKSPVVGVPRWPIPRAT